MTAPPPLLERLWTEPMGWAEPKGGVGGAKKGACPVTPPPLERLWEEPMGWAEATKWAEPNGGV